MARPLRLQIPGGVYHVISRGNHRQEIFLDDDDRCSFLGTLRSVVERLNVLCHAYCLMGNHYHLLVETPDANLSLAIRQLNGVYAQSFNRRHERVGHLFQGRFTSKLVEKDTYLLVLSRYIVLNPVRAALAVSAAAWPWSSYRAHAGHVEPPGFLSVDWLLGSFDPIDRRRAQDAFRRFVHDGIDEPGPPSDDSPILGSDAFTKQLRDQFERAAPLREIPRVQRYAARPTLRQIFADSRDRESRDERIRQAHVDHGYTMAAIAEHLNVHPMTISRAVRKMLECET